MAQKDLELHLSQITTLWTMVLEAAQGSDTNRNDACEKLMQRYGGAVYRYLSVVVGDANVAEDLTQEFAVRFLRGDFRNVNPERGRFRSFVKTAVLNLVTDHRRRQKTRPPLLSPDAPEPEAAAEEISDMDREFLDSWRNELLTRAWEALERHQENSDQPFHTVLRFRADNPDLRSAQMAEKLSNQLGKAVTDNWVRQILFRARKLYADFLLDDVMHSLKDPSLDQVKEELLDLGLLDYCAPALEQRTQVR